LTGPLRYSRYMALDLLVLVCFAGMLVAGVLMIAGLLRI
jgi:hypothetical protein